MTPHPHISVNYHQTFEGFRGDAEGCSLPCLLSSKRPLLQKLIFSPQGFLLKSQHCEGCSSVNSQLVTVVVKHGSESCLGPRL